MRIGKGSMNYKVKLWDIFEKLNIPLSFKSAWQRFARSFLTTLIILLSLYIVNGLVKLAFNWPYCTNACFALQANDCCFAETYSLVRSMVLLSVIFLCSFFSIKLTKRGKLACSTATTAFTLVILSAVLVANGFGLLVILTSCITAFFALFGGYRASFLRKRI